MIRRRWRRQDTEGRGDIPKGMSQRAAMGVFSGAAGSGGTRCCRSAAPRHGGPIFEDACWRPLRPAPSGGAVSGGQSAAGMAQGLNAKGGQGRGGVNPGQEPGAGAWCTCRTGRRGEGAQLLELRDPGTLRHGVLWTWAFVDLNEGGACAIKGRGGTRGLVNAYNICIINMIYVRWMEAGAGPAGAARADQGGYAASEGHHVDLDVR